VQKDAEISQRPFEHNDEQQSPFALHAFPAVLHLSFSGTQLPPEQTAPQHSPSVVHFPLSETHAEALQELLTQLTLQQSGPDLHDEPAGLQAPKVVQRCVVPSHAPAQQSLELAQGLPAPRQPGEPLPPSRPVELLPAVAPVPVVPLPDDPPEPEPFPLPPLETEPSALEPPETEPSTPPCVPAAPPCPIPPVPELLELLHAVPQSKAAAVAVTQQIFARNCVLSMSSTFH
jgi:hypothetical protein